MRKTNTTTNTNKPLKIYVYGGKEYFKTNAKTYIGYSDTGYFQINEIRDGGAF
jgi:hypothetical protein